MIPNESGAATSVSDDESDAHEGRDCGLAPVRGPRGVPGL